MNSRRRLGLILLFPTLALASEASTEEHPIFFVGLEGGYQIGLDSKYSGGDPTSGLFGVNTGVEITDDWSWDIGYQYHDNMDASKTSINVKTWLIDSAIRYNVISKENWDVFGKLGAAYWHIEKSNELNEVQDGYGFSPLVELGLEYSLTKKLGLQVSSQYIYGIGDSKTGQYDNLAVIFGMKYEFGQSESEPSITTINNINKKESYPTKSISKTKYPYKHIKKTFNISLSSNSSSLSVTQAHKVREIANSIQENSSDVAIEVIGHTDSSGTKAYNQKLSVERAVVVAELLKSLGLKNAEIEIKGLGESQPIDTNMTSSGRAHNRRVEVNIKNKANVNKENGNDQF